MGRESSQVGEISSLQRPLKFQSILHIIMPVTKETVGGSCSPQTLKKRVFSSPGSTSIFNKWHSLTLTDRETWGSNPSLFLTETSLLKTEIPRIITQPVFTLEFNPASEYTQVNQFALSVFYSLSSGALDLE
jgi:hypothetical protein